MADAQNSANPIPGFDINALNGMLGNIPNLQNMLSGVNFNQLMPLLPSVIKMMGNSFGTSGNPGYNYGYNNSQSINSNSGYYGNPGYYSGGPGYQMNPSATPFVIPPHLQADPKFVILNTIRPIIPQDKAYIVDQIARLLVLYITVTSLLPKKPPAVEVMNPPASTPEAAAPPTLLPPQI